MPKIDYNKHIWEGWTVRSFINELEQPLNSIMAEQSWLPSIKTKTELKTWCMNNQPYYKKYIPGVVNHFAQLYKIK